MSAAAVGTSGTAAMFDERIDPGRVSSFLLAAAMHLALFAVLVFGVQWQNRPPEAVEVELWNEPVPAPVQVEPKPVPEVAKPAPEPIVAKPDIALKEPVKVTPTAKPVPKPEPSKPKVDDTQKRMREELAREQASLAIDREQQQIKEQLTRDAASASSKALAAWAEKVRLLIRSRIRIDVAQAVSGNPESVFMVTLLPNYEVQKISMTKSSGNKAYDEEVERVITIFKTSPLPKPDRPELLNRELRLTFRPKD